MFYVLDKDFVIIEELNAISHQWRPRYYEYGDFATKLALKNYSTDFMYIYKPEKKQIGVINCRNIKSEGNGTFAYISGYFYEAQLSRAVIFDNNIPGSNIVDTCRQLFQSRCVTDLHENTWKLGEYVATTQKVDAYPDNKTEIGLINASLLKSVDFSQKMTFDYTTKEFKYDIWKGKDRTLENADRCFFSDSWGNINKYDSKDDDSDYKNFAEVAITRDNEDNPKVIRTTYSLAKSGEKLNKIHLDITDTESETDAEAISKAQTQALLELLNHTKLSSIEFEAVAKFYKYEEDYDLGDLIRINFDALGLSYTSRIIEVEEVYEENKQIIVPHFGDKRKTIYERSRF